MIYFYTSICFTGSTDTGDISLVVLSFISSVLFYFCIFSFCLICYYNDVYTIGGIITV